MANYNSTWVYTKNKKIREAITDKIKNTHHEIENRIKNDEFLYVSSRNDTLYDVLIEISKQFPEEEIRADVTFEYDWHGEVSRLFFKNGEFTEKESVLGVYISPENEKKLAYCFKEKKYDVIDEIREIATQYKVFKPITNDPEKTIVFLSKVYFEIIYEKYMLKIEFDYVRDFGSYDMKLDILEKQVKTTEKWVEATAHILPF